MKTTPHRAIRFGACQLSLLLGFFVQLLSVLVLGRPASAQVQQAWLRRFTNGTPTALKVDEAGYVYVTGSAIGTNGTSDFLTIKYDANGGHLWEAFYDGPSNRVDAASTLAIDSTGHVYVTGISGPPPG